MRIKLLKPARIKHNTGDIVEVAPEEAAFLLSVFAAEKIEEEPAPKEKTAPKRKTK